MISIKFMTPQEVQLEIAANVRAKRLSLNLSQKTLSETSGVSYAVLKKFEHTGEISLKSLLKLALNLNSLDEFNKLFSLDGQKKALTLDELMKDDIRKRGRK